MNKRARLLFLGVGSLVLLAIVASWFGVGTAREHARFENAVDIATEASEAGAKGKRACAQAATAIDSGLDEAEQRLGTDKLVAAYRALGDCQMLLGQYAAAADTFEAVVRHKAQQARTHADLARALSRLGRHSEAVRSATLAVQLAPTQWRSHRTLGIVLSAAGRDQEAIAALRKARSLAPASEYDSADRAITRLEQKTDPAKGENAQ